MKSNFHNLNLINGFKKKKKKEQKLISNLIMQ